MGVCLRRFLISRRRSHGSSLRKRKQRIEGGAAPAFDAVVADCVHPFEGGEHVFRAHARRKQRLVAIADGRLHDADSGHISRSGGKSGSTGARPCYNFINAITMPVAGEFDTAR